MKTDAKTAEPNTDVQVRMLIDIMGGFHDHPDGVKRGQIISLDARSALEYEYFGYCEPVGAEDETPRERKERVASTTAAVQGFMAAQAAALERARLDASTGQPLSRRR